MGSDVTRQARGSETETTIAPLDATKVIASQETPLDMHRMLYMLNCLAVRSGEELHR